MLNIKLLVWVLVAVGGFYLPTVATGGEGAAVAPLPSAACLALADALAAKVPTIIVGDIESAPRFSDTVSAHDRAFATAFWGFGLSKVKVRKIIRSTGPMPDLIYVQKPNLKEPITKGWGANVSDDGRSKLFFLIPGKELHDYTTYHPLPFARETQILREAIKAPPASDTFEKLGVADVLNAGSWFEIFDGRGAITVKTTLPPQVRPPVTPSPPGQFSHVRAREADERYPPYTLPKEFLDDLEVLLKSSDQIEAADDKGVPAIRSKLRSDEARQVLDQWLTEVRKRQSAKP